MDIDRFKRECKDLLIQDTDRCLNFILKKIDVKSSLYNEVIVLKTRGTYINLSVIRGVEDSDKISRERNRLVLSMTKLIDQIGSGDLVSEEVSGNLGLILEGLDVDRTIEFLRNLRLESDASIHPDSETNMKGNVEKISSHKLKDGNNERIDCDKCNNLGYISIKKQTVFGELVTSIDCPNCA